MQFLTTLLNCFFKSSLKRLPCSQPENATWDNAKKGDKLVAEFETNPNLKKIDQFRSAVKTLLTVPGS